MKRELKTVAVILGALHLVGLLGGAGWLLSSGRLDGQKLGIIADVMGPSTLPENFREKLHQLMDPAPTTQPTTTPAVKAPEVKAVREALASSASERIAAVQAALERQRLEVAHEAQELRHRQELLEQRRTEIDKKLVDFETRRAEFERQQLQARSQNRDENFQRSLALYLELKPRQIKEIFAGLAPETVTAYLKAMDPAIAARIIQEFKTPPEQQFIKDVLEKIRADGTGSATNPGAGTTPAAPKAAG